MRTKLSLLALLVFAAHALAQDVIHGKCVGVTDGDTIQVFAPGRPLLRIRLAFCDAPEMGQAFGYRAKQAMSELVFGKEVELHPHAIDRYGRTVAMVFVDGRDVGLELIKEGLAWAYDHYLPEASPEIQAQYPAAETAARVSRLGLWVDTNPLPPWDALAAAQEHVRDLDKLKKLVSLSVLVTTTEEFVDHAAVADGASNLFVQLFGAQAGHVRVVYGVYSAPIAAPVMVQTVFEIE